MQTLTTYFKIGLEYSMKIANLLVKTSLKALKMRGNLQGKDNFASMRKGFDDACASMPLQDKVSFKTATIAGMNCEWALPEIRDNQQVILYFHGGGYCIGSIRSSRGLCSRLAHDAKRAVLTFEYRLAPEIPYPAALQDAISVYQWLLDADYEPENIAFVGDSAGGGLMLSTLLYLRDKKVPLPACANAFSPWTDLTASSDSLVRNAEADPFIDAESVRNWAKYYATDQDLKKPYLSAVYGDYQGCPPIMFQVGTEETLYDDTIRTVERIRATGGFARLDIFKDMVHVFQMYWPFLPESKIAIKQTADFIKQYTVKKGRFAV